MRLRRIVILLWTLCILLAGASSQQHLAFLGQPPFRCYASRATPPGYALYRALAVAVQDADQEGTDLVVTYDLTEATSTLFRISSTGGQLSTTKHFPLSGPVEYVVGLQAGGSTGTITANLSVIVVPESDTMPRFEHEQYLVSVGEDVPPNTPLTIVHCFSLDPSSSTSLYTVVNGNTEEDIAINGSTGVLVVHRPLDRERKDTYVLTVRYVDDTAAVDTSVRIAVGDVNDNWPVFSETLYTVSVGEGLELGSCVLSVHASDSDAGPNGTLVYSLQNSSTTFSLEVGGKLLLASPLDYEKQSQYFFNVVTRDGGKPPRSSVATVQVDVTNIDDECPLFENHIFVMEVPYNVSKPPQAGKLVVRVLAYDPDNFTPSPSYAIVSGNEEGVFRLNGTTGEVFLLRDDKDIRGQYSLNVSASDESCTGQSSVLVHIGIGNINDFSPTFDEESCTASFRENPSEGTHLATLVAVDQDIGVNGLLSYALVTTSELLAVNSSSGAVTSKQPPGEYDRENQPLIQGGVTVTDGGGRQDYCLLTLELLDENDNAPLFELAEYNVSVEQGSSPGTPVVLVQASDLDLQANGRVHYSLSYSNQTSLPFSVDPATGLVTRSNSSIPQDANCFLLEVRAEDEGTPSLSSSVPVNIAIVRSGSPPVFENMEMTGSLEENAPVGNTVFSVKVTEDSLPVAFGTPAGMDYRSNKDKTFVILTNSNDAKEGIVSVGSESVVDYEKLSPFDNFKFLISATNSDGTSLMTVTVNIEDVNDNVPTFDDEETTIHYPEGSCEGKVITVFRASDLDMDTIEYQLAKFNDWMYFNLSLEGVLTCISDFDAEMNMSYELAVEAYNPTSSGIRKTQIVEIVITDMNDSPPSFLQDTYYLNLSEAHSIHTKVFSFASQITDPDSSASFTLSILEGGDGTFSVDGSGSLYLTSRLDYETVMDYALRLQVSDGMHTDECILFVSVVNEDDEPPVFSNPSYTSQVVENAAVGTYVLTLVATDPDTESIQYQLRGLAEGKFSVDSSGVVTVSGPVDREEFVNGQIVFLAFAEGGPISSADVVIDVLDVNDYVPRFSEEFSGRVEENMEASGAGVFVMQVRALDLDQGQNGTVTYSLASGAENGFEIDPESGVIVTHRMYDREETPVYSLTVLASDNGIPHQLNSSTDVLVWVGDANDNPPFFPFPYMYARVFEDAPHNHLVLSIPASDLDNGTNASITFSIVSGNEQGIFVLDSTSGSVFVDQSLDYEVPAIRSFMLQLLLQDEGVPTALKGTGEGLLEVQVLDRNDNAPSLMLDLIVSSIAENVPLGTDLAVVTATDKDSESNFAFSIASGDEGGYLTLVSNGNRATITTHRMLDYEDYPAFCLCVEVSDGGMPPLTSSLVVNISITDVNDEPPAFSEAIYNLSIPENSPQNPSLIQLLAFDPDTGPGGVVAGYKLTSQSMGLGFSLDPSSGWLGTTMSFDRELQSKYSLVVEAYDGAAVPLTGTAIVMVAITDVNDSPSVNGGHLDVVVIALDGKVTPGVLGVLFFMDPDSSDDFTNCSVTSGADLMFAVLNSTCELILVEPSPPEGTYQLSVMGCDSSHSPVSSTVTISVTHISTSRLQRLGFFTVTLNCPTSAYLRHGWYSFPPLLSSALGNSNLSVFSLQTGYHEPSASTDLSFTLEVELAQSEVMQQLYQHRDALGLGDDRTCSVWSLPANPCVSEPCFNQAQCKASSLVLETSLVASSDQFILFAPPVQLGYMCECVVGTAGDNCQENFDDCYSNPCLYGGSCKDGLQDFTCSCPVGTSGTDCSHNPDECLGSPCLNGGTCTNGLGSANCQCVPGDYGPFCQYQYFVPAPHCSPEPCANAAQCSAGRDGFTCLCPQGFYGELCEEETLVGGGCVGNPCRHGSTCTDTPVGPSCTCSPGFTGPLCRWPLNNCELEPCQNSASCEPGLYGSYQCTCTPGYTGEDCSDLLSRCDPSPCANGSRCRETDGGGSPKCECTSGFHGPNCELPLTPENTCVSSPCGSNVTCPFPCVEMDPCQLPSPPCENAGTCIYTPDSFFCECPEGYAGEHCQVRCPVGRRGDFCSEDIDYCPSHLCSNGSTCVEEEGGFACLCPPGHTGDTCDEEISCGLLECGNGGTCHYTHNNTLPTCQCRDNHNGVSCELLSVSFFGSSDVPSYRGFSSLEQNGRGSVELEFATADSNGLLLFNTQYQAGLSQELLAVELVGGRVRVRVWLGEGSQGSVLVASSDVWASDGLWHRLSIQWQAENLVVNLDHCLLLSEDLLEFTNCGASTVVPGVKRFLDLGLPLWVGGAPMDAGPEAILGGTSRGITACVRNVLIGGETLDLERFIAEENSKAGCPQLDDACRNEVCEGGECVASWNGHRCICPPRFEGQSCHQATNSTHFSAGSYARFTLKDGSGGGGSAVRRREEGPRSTFEETVSLWFRTEGQSVVLFHMGGDGVNTDHVSIQLMQGEVVYLVNLGGGEETVSVPMLQPALNDGQWHALGVWRVGLGVWLTLDSVSVLNHTLGGTHVTLDISSSQLFAGGSPNLPAGHQWCLQDPRLGGFALPTSGSNDIASVDFTGSVTSGCGIGPCYPHPCGVGVCLEHGGAVPGYVCDCAGGVRQPEPCQDPPESGRLLPTALSAAAGLLSLLGVVGMVLGMLLVWRWTRRRRHRKFLVSANKTQLGRRHRTLFGPTGALVISNDPGGGEEDTNMDWLEEEEEEEEEGLTVVTNAGVGGDEKGEGGWEGGRRPNSPTIHAFLEEKLRELELESPSGLETLHHYTEEGSEPTATSLSSLSIESVCEKQYSIDRLQWGGSKFAPLVDLVEEVLRKRGEEEEEEEEESGSDHTIQADS